MYEYKQQHVPQKGTRVRKRNEHADPALIMRIAASQPEMIRKLDQRGILERNSSVNPASKRGEVSRVSNFAREYEYVKRVRYAPQNRKPVK